VVELEAADGAVPEVARDGGHAVERDQVACHPGVVVRHRGQHPVQVSVTIAEVADQEQEHRVHVGLEAEPAHHDQPDGVQDEGEGDPVGQLLRDPAERRRTGPAPGAAGVAVSEDDAWEDQQKREQGRKGEAHSASGR
jgi:hypothetical protein